MLSFYFSYQSIESSTNQQTFTNNEKHFPEDDEIVRDIVTINPHPYSPPLSSSSSRLISSSSTSSSNSSTSTVLLASQSSTIIPNSQSKSTSVSHLPRPVITTVNSSIKPSSRLKVPTKTIPLTSKLKAPSTINTKPTPLQRKPIGITNHQSSTTMNKLSQQQV